MDLSDPGLDNLLALIAESFRVERNRDPLYIDFGGNLASIAMQQHQVVFGRRGSGKSCLLLHYNKQNKQSNDQFSIYLNADDYKGHHYPDVVLRLVLSTFETLLHNRSLIQKLLFLRYRALEQYVSELRMLIDEPNEALVRRDVAKTGKAVGKIEAEINVIKASYGREAETATKLNSEFTAYKMDFLERHLPDYRAALQHFLKHSSYRFGSLIVDDFYLVYKPSQPDLIDYLHRLLRGSGIYLKLGTIRYRTDLMKNVGQTIGVQLGQDVQQIDLDHTLENLEETKSFLERVLDELGAKVKLLNVAEAFVSPDGRSALALASGGVPRDYLTIFAAAVRGARAKNASAKWITPRDVHKAGARHHYQSKLQALKQDAGQDAELLDSILGDIVQFALKEKKKTVILISQEEARKHEGSHARIRQLMDAKFLHIVEPDTSAAQNRPGRYEAYALDTSTFMEPRLRGIDIIPFWEFDEQRRRKGVREAPVYQLSRVVAIEANGRSKGNSISVLDTLEADDSFAEEEA